MKVKNERWSVNTRDFKHGKYCLSHCLHFATALAAGLDEAVDIAEKFPNDPKNLLEMEKGNDYEELVLAQIKDSLPAGGFDQIAEHSNSDNTKDCQSSVSTAMKFVRKYCQVGFPREICIKKSVSPVTMTPPGSSSTEAMNCPVAE
jgi:hypothetical protein